MDGIHLVYLYILERTVLKSLMKGWGKILKTGAGRERGGGGYWTERNKTVLVGVRRMYVTKTPVVSRYEGQ